MLTRIFVRLFSDKKTCLQRTKILNFSKSLLHRSIPLIKPHIHSFSLKFSCRFFANLTIFGYPDTELFNVLRLNIKERARELNHDLVMQLIGILTQRPSEDNGSILQDIHTYIQTNYDKFNYDELKKVQHCYFICDKSNRLPFSPLFNQDKEEYLERKLKVSLKETTEDFLEKSGLKFPKDMIVTISNERSKIVVRFVKTGQKLTLYGISHMDKKEILEMRRTVYKEKNPILYFFELPPAEYTKFKSLKIQTNEIKKNKTASFFFENLDFTQKKSVKTPENLLAEYGEFSFLNKEFLDFYVQNYIMKNGEEYEFNESQNLVYTSDWGLKKPDEKASLLYIISMNQSPKAKENRFIFADISPCDEILLFTSTKSNEDLKILYERLRLVWVNELIHWLKKVNKIGCPMCSKQNDFGPQDIYNSLGDMDFDYSIRETAMAYKIVTGMAGNKDMKECIGFFGSDHVLDIVKNIGRIMEVEPQFFEKNNGEKGLEEINRELIWKRIDYGKMLQNEEKLEENMSKWALLASAFSRKRFFFGNIFII